MWGIVLGCLYVPCALLVASLVYAFLYFNFVPALSFQQPLYFRFGSVKNFPPADDINLIIGACLIAARSDLWQWPTSEEQ